MSLFQKKTVAQLIAETELGEYKLKKALTAFDLTFLGIGAIIGTGIFVLTGIAAAKYAGPALVLSFVMSGLACAFAALCYAEFASTIPVSGSAYTYGYAVLGEFFAWIIGWDLILEYGLAVSTVAIGWSGYFMKLLEGFGIHLPVWATGAPGVAPGTVINVPAILILLVVGYLISIGVRESAKVNNIMVWIKLAAVLIFIFVAVWYVKPANWVPFMPFGWNGIMTGAAIVFFAYIGFDAVSTAAEETVNPSRDLPRGIIWSLAICTVLYIVVAGILTGVASYTQLNTPAPVALALQLIGQNWVAGIISLGALCGITTVLLVMYYGTTRLLFAMSRDGLLPPVFSKIHDKYRTPYTSTWLMFVLMALVAGLTPIGIVAELVNFGTLAAFVVVSASVIVLRKTQPDLKRGYTCPGVPWIPLLSIFFCLYLMISLPLITWMRFLIWLVIGLVLYFAYGRFHSKLNEGQKSSTPA